MAGLYPGNRRRRRGRVLNGAGFPQGMMAILCSQEILALKRNRGILSIPAEPRTS